MRKLLLCCVSIALSGMSLFAEPLVLEQAKPVLEPKEVETGFSDLAYQFDEAKITNAAGAVVTDMTMTAIAASVFARYAFSPKVEASLHIPYLSLSTKNTPTGGSAVTTEDSGLADPMIGVKYLLSKESKWSKALALNITYPMGKESTKMPGAFRNGMNIRPAVFVTKACEKLTWNINISYDMKSEYTDENEIKQKPGDVLSAGIGIEKPCPKLKNVNLIGEFIYNSLAEAKSSGVAVSGSAGSQLDLGFGARYNKGSWKTKLGLLLSLGEEKYRLYDYRIIAGLTYLFKTK